VSAAYDAGEWSDLFVATAGATAALSGLRTGRAGRRRAQPDRGGGCGLYWVLAGVVAAIASAATNAWVLLIEILR
jgi:hypothetical protein